MLVILLNFNFTLAVSNYCPVVVKPLSHRWKFLAKVNCSSNFC